MNHNPKEEAYDEQINPLMAQIIKICNENGIPFVASFQLATAEEDEEGEFFCTSCSLLEGCSDKLVEAKQILYDKTPPWTLTTILRKGSMQA